ncbi:hypothetical protein [Ferruginibacter sp. SUN106]|uniref:hypothetical protein n=1 Tax=Ferruginibacter sp. SUN106 TaxID=2978348 RepID=UPI003D363682
MSTIKKGNTVITSGRVKLQPESASFTKQCFISTPFLFKERPVVIVTVSTEETSTAYVTYGVENDPNAVNETRFKISASNNTVRDETAGCYWCDWIIMGEITEEKIIP